MNVVNLRVEPPLNDIVAQLRALSDRIENGTEDAFQSVIVFGIPTNDFRPVCFTFGCVPSRHELAGILMHGAQLTLTDKDSE